MTSNKRQVLKKFLLDHLDGDNPTEHLNQEFTDDIKLWIDREMGVSYSKSMIISILKEIVECNDNDFYYQTKDGKFSYSDMNGTNERNLPKYCWFFY